ncbi:tetratricopeptide repeat protein [Polyangium sp. 6x1]|uniref:tetratricopeptide repeat protein n=1 Tax=Polyangium sp. 6x1 TaxID=3042689 RepID=UPI002482F3D6|nr:tetratricopeptide repeat protein [Polyangium sp. 6x1]MDI1443611.1 tetratricopeptide repeat protein [Polyangium sp. 6x1]
MDRLLQGSGALPGGKGYVENPTDADYAAAARWALEQKDLRLAIQQVSAAIALKPLHEPYLHLLDRIVGRAKGPLLLVQLPQDGAFFGLCAVRARVLARLGRVEEALRHLFDAVEFSPETPFLPWAVAWIDPSKRARSVLPETVARGLLALTDGLRIVDECGEGARTNLEAALRIARRMRREHPANGALIVAEARVLRVLGRADEALALLGDEAGWELAVERAAILRDLGCRGEQVRALEQAAAARPAEPSTYLDLGDAYLDDGRPEEAAAAYERALALDASSEWARSSLVYAEALGGKAGDLPKVCGSLSDPAVEARVRKLEADLSAYESRLSDPVDPVVAVVRSVLERAPETDADKQLVVRVRADRPLAPSAHVSFAQALARVGRRGRLLVEHAGPAAFGPLWRPSPHGGVPAVDRPPDSVLQAVGALTRERFEWKTWVARAGELALSIGDAQHVVDAMAHPLDLPPASDPVRWVHGFQVAAALVVARGPWPVEDRQRWLTLLLDAQDDWTAAAALLGLRALGDGGAQLVERLRALIPVDDEPLRPLSRALAITGAELSTGATQAEFFRLRARVRHELDRGTDVALRSPPRPR